MAGRLQGKVAMVTGAARGLGRTHAVRLAEEGADVLALDIAAPVRETGYMPAGVEDLDETVALVEKQGRRALARRVDVRDQGALDAAVAEGLRELGPIEIVAANAGIMGAGLIWEITEDEWQDMLDVNLSGVWHTIKAVVPSMIEAGRGGSVIVTSSVAGLKGSPFVGHYAASKHGVVGLVRTCALEFAPHRIRVNSVHPTGLATSMGNIPRILELFQERPDLAGSYGNALPVDRVDPVDVSNAMIWLASDEARYVTGVALPVDAGALIR
jgi:SDR family mycofactocin-dependent oxidoreductase